MGPKRRRVVSEKVKKARKAINKKANQGVQEPLVLDPDVEALRWRFVEWEGIPPDSRDLVVTFLSVKDNMLGLNNAMTNKKGDLRNQLVASYKDAIIPAWHTYPFRNPKGMFSNDGFKELHKVLDMGIDLQTVNLIVWSSSESRETSHPDKVLLQLVQGENDQQKLAELYATKWSPSKDRNLPSGDDENENESENQNGDGGEGGEAIDVASIQQTLYAATAKRYLVVMKALLKRGADVNADSDHGSMPPLHLAADNGHVDVAKVLLEHGADIHKTWDDGRTQKFTPLILASKKGHLGAVKILVEAADEKRKKYNKYVDKATSIPQIAPPNPNENPPAEPLPPKGDTALCLASLHGYTNVVEYLIGAGADVNKHADNSDSPVQAAVKGPNPKIVRMLLQSGAKANPPLSSEGKSPLYQATEKACGTRNVENKAAYEEIVYILISAGANIDRAATNSNGSNPLLFTARHDNVAVMRALLDAGANVDAALGSGETSLFRTSSRGNVEQARMLLEKGADIDRPNDKQATPLYIAAQNGHVEVMQLLVEKGANINPPVCSQGKTLLYVATKAVCTTNCQGDEYTAFLEAVLKLIKAGADVNLAATGGSSPGCTPLLMTARHGNVAVMRALLDAGATVDAANNSSETPLFLASSRGNVEQARMLLEKGADIDRPNDKQATPLYIAAQNGHVEVMQLLVEKGANINPPVCSEGKTLLYVATEGACKGTDDEATMIVYVELLDILIKGADDIDQAATGNNNGCNPLLMTAGYGNVAMMRALLDAGATVDRALNSGETSLFRASSGGNVEQVRMLLEKGADIDRPNETLTTPLYIAAQNGHLEAMRLLVERGLSDAAAAGYDQITGIDNAPDGTNGKTPLYAALERGHMEVGKLLIERGGADTTVTVKGQSLEQASTKMEIVVMLRLTERDRDLAVIAAALSTDTAAVADEIKRDDEVAEAEKDAKKAEEEAKAAGAAAAGAAAGGSAPAPAPPMSTPSSASAEAEAKTDQEVADDMDDEEDEDYNPDEDDEEDEEGDSDSDSDSADYLPEVVVARQQGNLSELESVSLQGVDGDTDQTAYEAGILAAGGTTSMDPGSAPAPTPPTSPPPSASAGRGRPSHTRSRKSDGTFCAAAPVTRRARRMSPGAGTTDVPAVPDAATLANRKVLKEATLRRRERQREDAFLEEQYQYYTLADGRQTQQVGNYWAQTVAGVEAASPANEFRPTHWYLSRQRDINSKMRAILFDWMTEVIQRTRYFDTNKLKRRDSERLALHPVQRVEETNVLHLSVNLTDRYLTRVVMKRLKLQLVGVVAMKIAFNALMDDMCAWDVYDWMNITDNAYSRSEVVEMEFQMLTTLEYNVFDGLEKFRPSPDADPWAQKPYYLPFSIPAYLHQYLLAVNAVDTTLGTLAHYYAEKSIHKSEICLAHPPQHIAAAALFAASILQCQMPSHFETAAPFHWKKQPVTRVLLRKCWTETHQEVTGLTVNPGDASLSNVLVELASEMVRFVDKTTVTASKRTLDACKKRYGDYSRLGQDVIKGVSGMPIPDLSSLVAWASLMRQERP